MRCSKLSKLELLTTHYSLLTTYYLLLTYYLLTRGAAVPSNRQAAARPLHGRQVRGHARRARLLHVGPY